MNTTGRIAPEQLEQAVKVVSAMRAQVARAMVGQAEVVEQTIAALLAGGHVLIEGVPGLGKTLLVRALAQTFDGKFARIQFTPDLMPADVTGHTLYDQSTGQFTTRRGPVFTNLLLADEINRAPAKTQAALLEVMQERQVTIEGTAHPLDATLHGARDAEPDRAGRHLPAARGAARPLPAQDADRLSAQNEEAEMVKRVTAGQVGDKLNVEPVATLIKPGTVVALQTITAAVGLDDKVLDYAVRIVRATRTWTGVAARRWSARRHRARARRARRGADRGARLRHPRRREAHGAARPAPPRHARAGARDRGSFDATRS